MTPAAARPSIAREGVNLMSAIRSVLERSPMTTFIVIAFAWTAAFTVAGSISLAFSLVALFGPAVAAIVATAAEGSFRTLRRRITDWRHHVGWYALALAIPFGVAAVARIVLMLIGQAPEGIGSVTAVELVIFVLVIGEEIGWRSFLQPRLRSRLGLAAAGLTTGVVWTLWHLPIYLQPDLGLVAFAAFAVWVIPLAVVMGVFSEATRFSAILATVMHGAANIATPIVLPGVDRVVWLVLGGVLYAVGVSAYLLLRRRQAFAEAPIAVASGADGGR
jgi:membrane protease YdiL (CAAX protease family)